MTDRDKAIALEIVRQMGRMFPMMVGLKKISVLKNGAMISWKARAKGKINTMKVVLNGNDLYDVEFLRLWNSKTKGPQITTVAEHSGIYNDMMPELFEKETGLYVSL